eukprot:2850738-Prymnesium_polylepis.1
MWGCTHDRGGDHRVGVGGVRVGTFCLGTWGPSGAGWGLGDAFWGLGDLRGTRVIAIARRCAPRPRLRRGPRFSGPGPRFRICVCVCHAPNLGAVP